MMGVRIAQKGAGIMKIGRLLMLYGIALVFSLASGAVVVRVLANRDRDITVRQALATQNEEQMVQVTGNVRLIGPNRYLLQDSTGILVLETCPAWYRRIDLPKINPVTVSGIVTTERDLSGNKRTFMEVYRFDWKNGQELVIRPSVGKPPWAFSASQPIRTGQP